VIRRILFFALFASVAAASLPGLGEHLRETWSLRRLPYEARRERVLGPFYASVKALRGGKKPLALIVADPSNSDAPIFANYYLYPRRTVVFHDLDEYRAAANEPHRPKEIARAGNTVELTTYAAMRDQRLRASHLVNGWTLSPPMRSFAVPLAASVDGFPPDRYVVEALLANGAAPAEVLLTFEPRGTAKSIALAPNEQRAFYDVVYQSFGIMEQGWLRVESSQPLRAGFAFVNRGRREIEPLPLVTAPAQVPPGNVAGDAKLWTINLQPPYAMTSRPAGVVPPLDRGVYAFVTIREADGRTRFVWP
jgi:hypothetical protein